MRTAIIDDILRRLDGRQPTGDEMRARQASLRRVAQLVCEIAEPQKRRGRQAPERQFG